jgi:hypothetical protein
MPPTLFVVICPARMRSTLLPSCTCILQHLCRQGRDAVQVTQELDLFSCDYFERDDAVGALPVGDATRDGAVQSVEVRTMVSGRLHLRLGNVGQLPDVKLNQMSTYSVCLSAAVLKAGSATEIRIVYAVCVFLRGCIWLFSNR